MGPVKVGLVGSGFISGIYLENSRIFQSFDVVACADLIPERAASRAKEYGVPRTCLTEELLSDPEIEIVLNLTTPDAHYSVAKSAIEAGKSVYNEKPLAIALADGINLVESARKAGVLVGGAPDTFLGGGIQTCRKLIDDGVIGDPVGATAFMVCPGHESWHPDPEFYYKKGGGPMFDMGPYYLTALVNLIGPINQVKASTRKTFEQRTITSEPLNGTKIDVDVPTHVTGILDFQNGATGVIITSFDVWSGQLPRIEIYGTKGTINVPDPNTFEGPVQMYTSEDKQWKETPLTYGYTFNSRGLGVADMASALRSGRDHRANGELTLHVLEVMHALHTASDNEKTVKMGTTVERPASLPPGLEKGEVDP